MDNINKKLDALIDALGFDVEKVESKQEFYSVFDTHLGKPIEEALPVSTITEVRYKLTKRDADTSMSDAWIKANADRGTFR